MHHKEIKFELRLLPTFHSSATMSIVLASVSWGRLLHTYSLANVRLPTYVQTGINTNRGKLIPRELYNIQFTDQRINLKVILLPTLTTKNFR